MLDAYIIDQIRRREEERRRINERPALELPLPEPPPPRRPDEAEAESEPKRVVIIDLQDLQLIPKHLSSVLELVFGSYPCFAMFLYCI